MQVPLYIAPVFSGAIFGWLYVQITYKIAPKRKITASVIMTMILGVLMLVLLFFTWYIPSFAMGEAVAYTIQDVVTMTAAIITLKVIYRKP